MIYRFDFIYIIFIEKSVGKNVLCGQNLCCKNVCGQTWAKCGQNVGKNIPSVGGVKVLSISLLWLCGQLWACVGLVLWVA